MTITGAFGRGNYILYHGNLEVAENSEMFLSLAKNLLTGTPYFVVVAGKNPSPGFQKRVARFPTVRLVANPSDQELDKLIAHAHINLLFTRQSTGIKLKLLHALFAGRHCLANPEMVEGSGLDRLCTVAGSMEESKILLVKLMGQAFSEQQVQDRKRALMEFSNRAGAEKILRILA